MRGVVIGAVLTAFVFGVDDETKKASKLKEELFEADRAFAKATAARRLDGWMEFYAKDAVRITPLGGKATVGTAAIRKLDAAMFADANTRLEWEPTDGGAWEDGKIGFTTGKAKIVGKSADGDEEVRFLGAYLTLWRKEPNGWKVILDTGAERKE